MENKINYSQSSIKSVPTTAEKESNNYHPHINALNDFRAIVILVFSLALLLLGIVLIIIGAIGQFSILNIVLGVFQIVGGIIGIAAAADTNKSLNLALAIIGLLLALFSLIALIVLFVLLFIGDAVIALISFVFWIIVVAFAFLLI